MKNLKLCKIFFTIVKLPKRLVKNHLYGVKIS